MIDKKYNELVNKILTEGKLRGDRTGTGTISIFNAQIEHNMSDGFPLLTGKKMYVGGIIHELLWFLNGDTNIKYLVKNGVNIWTSDAYREYKKIVSKTKEPILTIEEFSEKIINDINFSNKFGELGPVYGKQWINWGEPKKIPITWYHGAPTDYKMVGINQIQQIIDKLNNNPDDRRIMVSAWNVSDIDKMALPPCHWSFELYTEELTLEERLGEADKFNPLIREDCLTKTHHPNESEELKLQYRMEWLDTLGVIPKRRLHLKWHQRSVDTFLGLPFNIASYGFLLHMLAQQTNMVAGTLIGDLTNVHIYKNHIEQCKEQISREPMKLPILKLNKAKDIFSYSYDDFKVQGYESHGLIKGEISV